MNEKILGYTLIFIGLLVIVFSGINVYNVFAGNAKPITLFTFKETKPQPVKLNLDETGQVSPTVDFNIMEILPLNIFEKPINSFAHLILMVFISSIGLKVATVGTQLVRPINVKLKTSDTKTTS